MKLLDLDPVFCLAVPNVDGRLIRRLPTMDGANGLTFRCPVPDHNHSVRVWFDRTVPTGPSAPPEFEPRPRWQVSGTALDSLTINPSIQVLAGDYCSWHGWIRDGEVITA